MSKSKSANVKAAGPKPADVYGHPTWVRTLRETVESVVIAFILAFLFRTFEAEAFVIPTGSMAPTLQGRHKDIVCPKCGYQYHTGASQEVHDNGAPRPNCHLISATCPMCRYTVKLDPNSATNRSEYPSYNGDRIIVSKFAYDLSDPERWDVVVFKYPEDAKTNYIKRLVGLPNERLKITDGDIYTAPLGSDDFQIERKGKKPKKLQAMLQPVFDNDYTVDELLDAGFPARWQPWHAENQSTPWTTTDRSRSYETAPAQADRGWLRYLHVLPTDAVWNAVENNRPIVVPRPSKIQDFYAYNDGELSRGCRNLPKQPSVWVGDLALDCELEVKKAAGAVILELIKGGRQFRCHIDLPSGQAKLSISGLPDFSPEAATPIRAPGNYELSFVNVDEQLLLWVDGEVVAFDAPTTYPPLDNNKADVSPLTPGSEQVGDLSPVGIAVEGGAAVKVSHLNIRRDIFYLSEDGVPMGMMNVAEPIELKAGQFFMLGDNSPQSKDSRYWRTEYFVDRSLLIGKALFIYWPHSFDRIEIGNVKIPFPFWPNFKQMGFVR